MPTYQIETPEHRYPAIVERGVIRSAAQYLPAKAGKVFVVSTEDVWRHQGPALEDALAGRQHEALFLPGGEDQKRLAPIERLAERIVERGGDRSSVLIAFGGGIVNDMAGFLAAIFMRGIPVVQIPTTLLAQVDAAVGGKTGVPKSRRFTTPVMPASASENKLSTVRGMIESAGEMVAFCSEPESEWRGALSR